MVAAVREGWDDIVEALLTHAADTSPTAASLMLQQPGAGGVTALHVAAFRQRSHIVRLLLEAGV